MARILLKVSPLMSTAMLAPIIDPKKAEIPKYILNGKVETPLLLNPATPMAFCMTMATLFVPLATLGGNPKKIKKGSEIKDPPPATVFIKPTTNPTNTSST